MLSDEEVNHQYLNPAFSYKYYMGHSVYVSNISPLATHLLSYLKTNGYQHYSPTHTPY